MPRHSHRVSKRDRFESVTTPPSSRSGTNYPCHDSHLQNLTDPYLGFGRALNVCILQVSIWNVTQAFRMLDSRDMHQNVSPTLDANLLIRVLSTALDQFS